MNLETLVVTAEGPQRAKISQSGGFLMADGSRLQLEGAGLARRIGTDPKSGRITSRWEILTSGVFPVGYWR